MARVDDFVGRLAPYAIDIGARYGLDPSLIIAQSALETGWGESVAGNNYFGVKSHGQGGGNSVRTHEEINGQWVPTTNNFRAYDGLQSSMEDYARFLRDNQRYSDVFNQTGVNDQIDAVARAGYATDSSYADKLKRIAGMFDLSSYGAAPTPRQPSALAAINAAAPRPRVSNPSIMGGRRPAPTSVLGYAATPTIAAQPPAPVMRAALRAGAGAAPTVMAGRQSGGSPVIAVSSQGSSPATLMRSSGGPSASFDATYHPGVDMNVYRANAAALGGGRWDQGTIDRALSSGTTLYRRA